MISYIPLKREVVLCVIMEPVFFSRISFIKINFVILNLVAQVSLGGEGPYLNDWIWLSVMMSGW